MKKKLLLLVLILVCLNFVYAADLEVKDTPVKSVVLPGESAIFDIQVHNYQGMYDEIKPVVMDSDWARKSGSEFYKIDSNTIFLDRLTLFPLGYLKPGVYALNVRFVSIKNPSVFVDKQLVVTIVDYKNILDIKLETNPQGIDPRKDNLVKLNLKSRYNINLDKLDVSLSGDLFGKNLVTSVKGLETKDEEFIISLDPLTKEGDYNINVLVKSGENVLANRNEKIKVNSYSDIKETKTKEFNFLINTLSITRVNNGNSMTNEVYKTTLSGFQKLFTKFYPDPSKIEKTKGGKSYEWIFSLQPGESYKVSLVTDYRTPLLILIILALIIYFAYKLLFTELSMHKKVLILKSREGGIAGVKVLIHIKNNGPSVKTIHLTDVAPSDFDIPHEYITLKPNSMRKEINGTMLTWEIPELIKGEERVITYKLKSRTGYKGRLLFQRSVCRYRSSLGKLSVTHSNEVRAYA